MANKHRKVWKVESGFPETTLRKTNTAKTENTFLETKLNFSLTVFPLTGKCFSLTGKCFCWLESVFRWPESVFRWPTFLMANKHRKVWKVVPRKVNSGKQTWPKRRKPYLAKMKTKMKIMVLAPAKECSPLPPPFCPSSLYSSVFRLSYGFSTLFLGFFFFSIFFLCFSLFAFSPLFVFSLLFLLFFLPALLCLLLGIYRDQSSSPSA